ncbi:MAG TPA: GNAT family N-acetyltransferase [Cytophagales bacterium]|nr:GNAT family N-acetyltransferase [Cytophagales bacterium]HAA19903.1 GNAT family N-acetyltransferase [Cytophagales bacterium]HAP62669.1 GNAT family N-acetyltransferase [Cytophagales bacterium]
MSKFPVLTPLSADYYPDIYRLLEANDLPNEDIDEIEITFWGVLLEERVVAVIGLQIYGDAGLLRSLAVDANHRNQSWAEDLIKELLKHCQILHLETIYLLTTTAKKYFQRKGFMEISREHVPGEIKKSTEFTELCPQDATAMYMPLVG